MKNVVIVLSTMLIGAGCASPTYQSRQSEVNSALTGAVVGGAIGGAIGNNVGDGENEALGAGLGALAGGLAGQRYGQGQDNTRHRIEGLEAQAQMETIMVQNTNGSYTPVVLTKVGYGQFRGPRGEIYTSRPTEDQLRIGYGF